MQTVLELKICQTIIGSLKIPKKNSSSPVKIHEFGVTIITVVCQYHR